MVNRPEIPHLFENDLRRSLSASRPRLLAIDPWVASSPLWAIISSERNVIYMRAFRNELSPGFTRCTISTPAQTSRQEQGSRPLAASRHDPIKRSVRLCAIPPRAARSLPASETVGPDGCDRPRN